MEQQLAGQTWLEKSLRGLRSSRPVHIRKLHACSARNVRLTLLPEHPLRIDCGVSLMLYLCHGRLYLLVSLLYTVATFISLG